MDFVRTNIVGTATLLEAPRAPPLGRFLHVSFNGTKSTARWFDEPAFSETHPIQPRSPYSASKAASDHLVLSYFHTYHFPALLTPLLEQLRAVSFPREVITAMILNAFFWPAAAGLWRRDERARLDPRADHCAGIDAVLRRGRDGEVYNLGGLCERPNSAMRAILTTGRDVADSLRHRPTRPRPPLCIDCRKAEREPGFALQSAWMTDWLPPSTGTARTKLVAAHQERGEYRTWFERNYAARPTARSLRPMKERGLMRVAVLGPKARSAVICAMSSTLRVMPCSLDCALPSIWPRPIASRSSPARSLGGARCALGV